METSFLTSHNLEESAQDQSLLAVTPPGAQLVSVETSTPAPEDVYPNWYNNWHLAWEVPNGYDPDTTGHGFADYHALSFGEAPDQGEWDKVGQVYKYDGSNYVLTDVFISFIGTGVWAIQASSGLG